VVIVAFKSAKMTVKLVLFLMAAAFVASAVWRYLQK
jgi:hypothetical protein